MSFQNISRSKNANKFNNLNTIQEDVGLNNADFIAVEQEMMERRKRVRRVCDKYGLGTGLRSHGGNVMRYPPSANYDVLYIDR